MFRHFSQAAVTFHTGTNNMSSSYCTTFYQLVCFQTFMVLICISLVNDCETIFVCLLILQRPFLVNFLFKSVSIVIDLFP